MSLAYNCFVPCDTAVDEMLINITAAQRLFLASLFIHSLYIY